MNTSILPFVDSYAPITLSPSNVPYDTSYTTSYTRPNSVLVYALQWTLRLMCVSSAMLAPWANYRLIRLFQERTYHRQSSAKWYIIFKAVFNTFYILTSTPIIFFMTFNTDIIHHNVFTCKFITYMHYLTDDLVSIMLMLLCIDRVIRITCAYRLRTRISLWICICVTILFILINIHHIVRLQHRDGFCHKVEMMVLESDFDVYYSYTFTSITWSIILLSSINLLVTVYCDRVRRLKLQHAQDEQHFRASLAKTIDIHSDNDRLGLIDHIGRQSRTNYELNRSR
jgi:hypothetical protein